MTTVNPTTVSPQSGNETCFNSLINKLPPADKFHIKELDWKAKTIYLLFQVASPVWLNDYLYISQKMCLIHHIPDIKASRVMKKQEIKRVGTFATN